MAVANCKLRLDEFTDIEQARIEMFALLKPQLIKVLIETTRKQEFGVVVENAYREIDYHYFFIDYMTIIRNEIDRIIESNGCITQEQFDYIVDKYEVNCILTKALCLDYNLFKTIYNRLLENIEYCDFSFIILETGGAEVDDFYITQEITDKIKLE